MPHLKIVRGENGRLREVGVEDVKIPEPTTDTTEEQIVAPESILSVSEDTETPPVEPEDAGEEQTTCGDCGKVCSSKAGLLAHIRAKHNKE